MSKRHPKQHATAPSYVRAQRNGAAIVARQAKHAERIARAAAKRAGTIALPGPRLEMVTPLSIDRASFGLDPLPEIG